MPDLKGGQQGTTELRASDWTPGFPGPGHCRQEPVCRAYRAVRGRRVAQFQSYPGPTATCVFLALETWLKLWCGLG